MSFIAINVGLLVINVSFDKELNLLGYYVQNLNKRYRFW
jgi:hypothetical protein